MIGSFSSMAKGGKQSRHPPRKTPSSRFLLLLTITLFAVVFLLGIASLPSLSRISSTESQSGHDLTSILHTSIQRGGIDERRDDRWVELISWEPRAFIHHNFLSKEECEYLIKLAKPHMKKSSVVDNVTGENKDSGGARTSSGAFLTCREDKIIRDIENRIAEWTFIPVDHGEALHVLRYEVGQKYEPHFDYFNDKYNIQIGGQRMATVLMYLSDVEEGGETVFPYARGNHSAVPYWDKLSECGKTGLAVKPKMGDALLFWSMSPGAVVDPLSLHGSCPVIRGRKWACTKWMRVYEYKN